MADLFAAVGYRCGQFGKWHLGDNYPYRPQDRGFHEAIYYPSSHIGSAADSWNNDYFDDTYWHNGRREKFAGLHDRRVLRRSDPLDGAASRSQPAVLLLSGDGGRARAAVRSRQLSPAVSRCSRGTWPASSA